MYVCVHDKFEQNIHVHEHKVFSISVCSILTLEDFHIENMISKASATNLPPTFVSSKVINKSIN